MTKDLKLFFDNFDKLAESPGGAHKLRELIRQLAVQGKLVDQNPKDEPASELLKKIKAEKEKLIKDGKIKKQKPLPPIELGEIPFELPTGWEWVRLGGLVAFEYGKGLPKDKKNNTGTVPVYGANGIMRYFSDALVYSQCIIVGRKGSAGALNISEMPCWPTDVTYFVQPSKTLSFYYIFSLLKSLRLENMAKGIKPGLNRNEAYDLIVGVPPLAEQKRIVVKVDELMLLCDVLEEKQEKVSHGRVVLNDSAINHLLNAETKNDFGKFWQLICDNFEVLYDNLENVKKLRQAILQFAVQGKLVPQDPNDEPASELLKKIKAEKEKLIKEGKIKKQKPLPPIELDEIPYKLPKGWEWTRLYEVGLINPRNNASDELQVAFSPMPLISDRYGVRPQFESRCWGEVKKGFTHFAEGDVAVAKITPCFQNGKSGVFRGLPNGLGAGTTELHVFRPLGATIIPEYVWIYLKSPRFLFNGEALMTGSAGQKRVPKNYFAGNLFPLPPTKEQKRIVTKIDELMTLVAELEEKLDQAKTNSDKLMASVVHHLLHPPLPQEQAVTDEKKSQTPYKDDAAVVCFLLAEMEKRQRPTTEFFIQKHIFVTKHHLHLPLNSLFVRKAAGPWSHELKQKAIFAATKMNWLRWDRQGNLVCGYSFNKGLNHAAIVLGESAAQLVQLVKDLKAFGTNGLERWTTILKVVEDLKETQQPITRANIQHEIDNWPDKSLKEIFTEESINHTINKMIKYKWLPTAPGQ